MDPRREFFAFILTTDRSLRPFDTLTMSIEVEYVPSVYSPVCRFVIISPVTDVFANHSPFSLDLSDHTTPHRKLSLTLCCLGSTLPPDDRGYPRWVHLASTTTGPTQCKLYRLILPRPRRPVGLRRRSDGDVFHFLDFRRHVGRSACGVEVQREGSWMCFWSSLCDAASRRSI